MSVTFTQEELFEALRAVELGVEETPNSFTKREFQRHFKISGGRAKDSIAAAVAQGLVRPEMIARVNSHGFVQHVMGYVLVEREAN